MQEITDPTHKLERNWTCNPDLCYDNNKRSSFVTENRHPYNKAGDGPEGPEVRKIAEQLQIYLPGRYITDIWMDKDYKISLKFPILIRGVTVKGKKLIFMLDNDTYLVNSLSMTGNWMWEKGKHVHLYLDLAKLDQEGKLIHNGKVYYDDTRRFGTFVVYNSTQDLIDSFKGKVGPDMLNEDVPYNLWLSQVKKLGTKQICEFLITQKYFSGIGNVYRSDIAYRAKLNPTRLLSSLSDKELETLYQASISVLRDAYHGNGYTGYKVFGQAGLYDPVVYRKKIGPMGFPVQETKCKGKRKIFWVSEVQK